MADDAGRLLTLDINTWGGMLPLARFQQDKCAAKRIAQTTTAHATDRGDRMACGPLIVPIGFQTPIHAARMIGAAASPCADDRSTGPRFICH